MSTEVPTNASEEVLLLNSGHGRRCQLTHENSSLTNSNFYALQGVLAYVAVQVFALQRHLSHQAALVHADIVM